jgi:hypothetical protein
MTPIGRRQFLATGVAAMGSMAGASRRIAAYTVDGPLGFMLHSLRAYAIKDLPGTLATVARRSGAHLRQLPADGARQPEGGAHRARRRSHGRQGRGQPRHSRDHARLYLAEVRRITQAPIRYVVYSHHHYDHIAGGAVFTSAGATIVSHKNAKPQLERLKNPAVALPDRLVDEKETLTVGRTRVELRYMGRNHSDNSLVISVPGQKVIYAADWLPLGELVWRNIFDSYIDEWFAGIDRVLALDWEKLVVGHARAHNPKG